MLAGVLFTVRDGAAAAQQRPLVTEDPETIGAGLVLIEGGFDEQHDVFYPASGLEGTCCGCRRSASASASARLPNCRLTAASITGSTSRSRGTGAAVAAAQFRPAITPTTSKTSSSPRRSGCCPKRRPPGLRLRFATRLPNASNESGLGLDTTDFFVSTLFGKTVQSIRFVGNAGLGILGDPTDGDPPERRVHLRRVSWRGRCRQGLEIVGEVNGRVNTRGGEPPVGTDSRGALRLGGRFTRAHRPRGRRGRSSA